MITQINNFISISSVVILYELIILLLFTINILNKNTVSNLLSPIVFLNIFIIFVMFLTDCKIDNNVKLWIVIIKTLLLIGILFITEFNINNLLISFSILIIYYIFSNINNVYSCDVKNIDLIKTLIVSTVTYVSLILSNKLCK